MDTTLTRRSFVKWGTATVGATALVGFTGCAPGGGKAEDASEGTQQKAGEWLNAPCYNNCSCGSSRCLNRVYVEDGVLRGVVQGVAVHGKGVTGLVAAVFPAGIGSFGHRDPP